MSQELEFLQRVQKALRSLRQEQTACASKVRPLGGQVAFTARLRCLSRSLWSRLTSRVICVDRVGAATSDALYEDLSQIAKTILVRMPPLQSALTAQMTSSETPTSLLSEQRRHCR